RLYGVSPEKVKVIYNGIDTSVYVPSPDQRVLEKYGIDPRLPFVLFVGRITRQKGIIHLVEAIRHLRSGVQLVLCAGEPDTPELGNEVKLQVERARRESDNPIFWIPEFLTRREVMTLYSMASVFVCPSVYEPFGLINVEAMACATPVVGSAVGGIPEIIVDGETGLLVPLRPKAPNDPEPLDPELFARDLAGAVNQLLDKPELARQMGMRGRKRVEEVFSWKSVALQTLDFYRQLLTNL
ncbi:MAG: glycosyltransferase, partial [Syntrophobacteraceae bacterium]